MYKNHVNKLANNVIAKKHLGIDEAMTYVLGEFTKSNANLYNDVWDEVQNILYPHGSGEDSNVCEY